MQHLMTWTRRLGESVQLAARAWRAWGPRQHLVAVTAAVAVGLAIGLATVLIPNPVFSRDIPPVPWNYPVWILSSALTGVLIASYVRPSAATDRASSQRDEGTGDRGGSMGTAAGVLAWFAVGCPVCNKIALLALGYTGALTWFAPAQPFLAGLALILASAAVVGRLRGQVACPLPPARRTAEVAT